MTALPHYQLDRLQRLKERLMRDITQRQQAIEALQNQIKGVDAAIEVLRAAGIEIEG